MPPQGGFCFSYIDYRLAKCYHESMTKTIKTWTISHSLEGFALDLYESSYWGTLVSDFIESSDMDWWGKYKNFPFCWISPWGWTWKIGTENYSLGTLWMDAGRKILNFAYRLEKSKLVKQIKMSDTEIKESFPEIWEELRYWLDEDDE